MVRRSNWIEHLEHHECCKVTRAAEKGCKVILPGASGDWLCISGSHFQKNHHHSGKLCDLILFWEDPSGRKLISVVEQKSGGFRPNEVSAQLQAGAEIAMDLTKDLAGVKFAPVLLHRRVTTIQLRELKKCRVRFDRKHLLIQSQRCGFDISKSDWA
jgi:hypothetical protein